ncbi:hypothetical protein BKA69DRAFT_1048944 [Paraphysoderma sedebokerense]|nr:hypothetical protein BKA69DRAFT_1048944 [Paraphysoderma sedebokerense]
MTGESPPPHPPPHPQSNEQLDSLLSPDNIIILPTPVSNAQLTPPHSAFDPSFPSISIDPSNLLLTSPYLPFNDQSPPLSGSTSPLLSPSDSCPRRGSTSMPSFSDTASIQSSASSDNMHTQEQASLLSVPEVTPLYEKRKKGGPGLKRKGLSKEEKEARKNDRIVRNRLAAQESREKKRKYVETLESTAQSLRTENQVLTESNERLTKRVKRLEEENQSLNQKIEWLMHQVTEMKANQQSGNGNAGQGHGHGETQGQRQGQDFLLASSENNNGVNPTAPASNESNNAPLDGVLTLDEITQLLFGGFSKPAAFGYLSSCKSSLLTLDPNDGSLTPMVLNPKLLNRLLQSYLGNISNSSSTQPSSSCYPLSPSLSASSLDCCSSDEFPAVEITESIPLQSDFNFNISDSHNLPVSVPLLHDDPFLFTPDSWSESSNDVADLSNFLSV